METAVPGQASRERRLDRLLAHYAESHRHPTNEIIHFMAIPLIMLSLLGLLHAVHPWLAYGLLALSMVYYARLQSPVLLACMLAWGALLIALVHAMGSWVLPASAAIFVGAWIAQFVGHRIEGRKPSFFEDLQYLLIGPLFVLTHFLRKTGIRW